MRAPLIVFDAVDIELFNEGYEVDIPIRQATRSLRTAIEIATFRIFGVVAGILAGVYAVVDDPDVVAGLGEGDAHALVDEGEGLKHLKSLV